MQRLFPIAITLMNCGAALVYLWNRHYQQAIYFSLVAAINMNVSW